MMKKRTLISMAALSALTATGCTGGPVASSASQGIIDGTIVGDNELMTVLASWNDAVYEMKKGATCTATLISPTAVLTAAHCVDPNFFSSHGGTPATRLFVTYFRDLAVAAKDVKNYIEYSDFDVHPNYNSNGTSDINDLAILHLKEPVVGKPVQKLATPDIMDKVADKSSVLIAGYGYAKYGDATQLGRLRKGISTFNGQMGKKELLTGNGSANRGCDGDSGGPVFADSTDEYQIGVASRMYSDTTCNTGIVYTRVDQYIDWIKSKVPNLGEPTKPAPDGGMPGGNDGGTSPGGGMDGGMMDGGDQVDSGSGPVDAGTPSDGQDAGGTMKNPSPEGGCSFSGTGSSLSLGLPLLFALLGLALIARRRQS